MNNPLDALFAVPHLYSPEISPDGKWVAWSWSNIASTAQVYVAPTDGSSAPLLLTNVKENVRVYSWASDSKSLVVGYDHDGDERTVLFEVSISEPKLLRRLTDSHPLYFIRGGTFHPSKKYLVYGANYDFALNAVVEATYLYRHDLETEEKRVLAKPEKPSYLEMGMNKKGTHLIYSRSDLSPGGRQWWIVGIDGTGDREILNFGAEAKVDASWTSDGTRVVFVADAGTYRKVGLWSLGNESIEWCIDDPVRNIESAFVPVGMQDVVVLEVREARTIATLFDPVTKKETVFSDKKYLEPLGVSASGEWVALSYNAQEPLDLVRVSAHDGTTTSLTGLSSYIPFDRSELAPAEDFRWKSSDGLSVQGWLYRPHGESVGTILSVHGGPTGHSEDLFDGELQYLVSQGFTVLEPNYRGSTGFTAQFEESIKKDGWGGREQDDILAAAQALVDAGISHKGKIGITGTSYGGYSAWCAITRAPRELIAAAAPICGMTDLVVDYYSTRPDLRGYSEEMMGGTPAQVPERYEKGSPIHSVGNITGKLLIVQGEQDPNVTMENVAAVEAELKKKNIPYELLLFPNEGHGVRKQENVKKLLVRLGEFFANAFENES